MSHKIHHFIIVNIIHCYFFNWLPPVYAQGCNFDTPHHTETNVAFYEVNHCDLLGNKSWFWGSQRYCSES